MPDCKLIFLSLSSLITVILAMYTGGVFSDVWVVVGDILPTIPA
jgi:hypothetical protein